MESGRLAAAIAFGICGLSLLYAIWFAIITCYFWLVRAVLTFVVAVAFATTFPA